MGKYYTEKITTTSPSDRASTMVAWLNAIDGITAEAYEYEYDSTTYGGGKILIDNTNIEIFIGFHPNAVGFSLMFSKLGDTNLTFKQANGGGTEVGLNLNVYISEDCILFSACQNANGFELIRVKADDDTTLVGYGTNLDTWYSSLKYIGDIHDLTFKDESNLDSVSYTYTNMFPYEAEIGSVDFIVQGYFVNSSNLKVYTSSLLKECSTTSLLSTVSLPDPLGSHITIGAHCIVPVDIS